MAKNMKDSGRIIRCMVRASSDGQMEGFMKEIMLMIKKKDMVPLDGLMVGFIKACGKMDASMVKADIQEEAEYPNRVCGKTGLV